MTKLLDLGSYGDLGFKPQPIMFLKRVLQFGIGSIDASPPEQPQQPLVSRPKRGFDTDHFKPITPFPRLKRPVLRPRVSDSFEGGEPLTRVDIKEEPPVPLPRLICAVSQPLWDDPWRFEEPTTPLGIEERLTDEGLERTVPQRSVNKLLPEEELLAGYLLARAVVGQKVDGEDLERLRCGDQSVRETRSLMPFGRGNVHGDIRQSSGEATRRSMGGRDLQSDPTVASNVLSRPIWAGAGLCGEHSDLCFGVHAARLLPDETAHLVKGKVDHAWVETIPARKNGKMSKSEKRHERQRTIVLDSWTDGPAIFAADSRFSLHGTGGMILESHGQEAGDQLKLAKTQAQKIARQLDPRKLPARNIADKGLWNAVSGVDKVFADRVSQQMDKEVSFQQAIAAGRKTLNTRLSDALTLVNPLHWHKNMVIAGSASKMRRNSGKSAANTSWVKTIDGWVEHASLQEAAGRETLEDKVATQAQRLASRKRQASKKDVAEAEKCAGTLSANTRNQIMAVAVARELAPEMSIRKAVQEAEVIVESARNLRRRIPRVQAGVTNRRE